MRNPIRNLTGRKHHSLSRATNKRSEVGFTAAGAKTVIPAKATAKVSFRIVPRQNPDEVVTAFREWVRKNTPKGIQTEVRVLSAAPGLVVNPNHPAIPVQEDENRDEYAA